MPFNRPTLGELISRAASDIEAELPGTDARLRRSNLSALARVHAAAVHGLYGYLQWMARQVLVDTADAEYLVRWAGLYGITRLAASFAKGQVTLSGTTGTVVAIGTILQRADGAQYATSASTTLVAGAATVAVQAEVGGASGNAAAGTKLTFVEPVGGVSSLATVTSAALTGGADAEDDPALRLRVMERMRTPPMGGSAADYIAWAKEVAGVTRAWVYPLEGGPGKVVVRFVRDNDPTILPDAGEVAAVQSYINARRPVTATVTVLAPTFQSLNPDISISPDTPDVRAAVEAELRGLLIREAAPGVRLYLSRIREAISAAAGEFDSTLIAPTADVVPPAGQIVTLGTITWI